MKARLSESVSGLSLTSSRQENVAVPLLRTFSTVCEIWLKGRAVLSSLTWPRLTPARPVSSAPVRPRIEGSPAMISIRGAAASSWPAILPTSSVGRNNRPFFSKNSPEPSGCTDSKFLVSPASFSASALPAALASSGVGASTTARISFSRSNACSNWIVALAPVEIGRNQRVDVGIDGEMARGIEARADREERAKGPGQEWQSAYKLQQLRQPDLSAHRFFLSLKEPAENARCLAEFHRPI